MSSSTSRRRRPVSAERRVKKPKADDSLDRLVWVQIWPRNHDVEESLPLQLCADELRQRLAPGSSVVIGPEYPCLSVTSVCPSSQRKRVVSELLEVFGSVVTPYGWDASDISDHYDPLPQHTPRPPEQVLRWYSVSAPPLLLHFLEQAVQAAIGAQPGVQIDPVPATSMGYSVRVLMPPQCAADLVARGLCMVPAEAGRAAYHIPVSVEAEEEPPGAGTPPRPAPPPVARVFIQTASTATQTVALPSPPPTSDAPTPGPTDRPPSRRRRPRRRRPGTAPQCFKCQRWGHVSSSCPSTTDVCRVCAGAHRSKDCDRGSLDPLCANCGSQDHGASSRQCAALPRASPAASPRPRAGSSTRPTRGFGRGFQGSVHHLLGPLISLITALGGLSEAPPPPLRRRRKKPPDPRRS